MEHVVVTTVRLEQRILKELDRLAEEGDSDRTTVLKQALKLGVKEIKLQHALTVYQLGEISVGRAAEIAEISLWRFLEILKERKIGFRTDEEDLGRQLKEL